MTYRRFTVKSEEALVRARGLARDKSHTAVTTGHLLAALFEADNFVALYLRRLGSEPEHTQARVSAFLAQQSVTTTYDTAETELALAPELSAALEAATRWAEELDDEYVSAENLLLGLAGGDDDLALTLQAAGVGRGGWQGVIRQRREVWRRQAQPRGEPLEFDPTVVEVLLAATRAAGEAGVSVAPAHVLVALLARSAGARALLDSLGLDAAGMAATATDIAGRAAPVPATVSVPVVSEALHQAMRAAGRAAGGLGEPDIGSVVVLRGLARAPDEVGELLRGVDEMLAMLQQRVREPVSRLSAAVMAQQRASRQSDLETAARLLHGEIPLLRQEIEALGKAEEALLCLLDERPGFQLSVNGLDDDPAAAAGGATAPDALAYQRLRDALDTAYIRDVSRRLLRWIGDQDQPPGDPVGLAAFCATIHDGPELQDGVDTLAGGELITGREAGRAAGRLALLGLLTRDEDTVRLTAAGLRCLEDGGGDPTTAATV